MRNLQVAVISCDAVNAEVLARGKESWQTSFKVFLARHDVDGERCALYLVGENGRREL